MPLTALDHYTVKTNDIEKTAQFAKRFRRGAGRCLRSTSQSLAKGRQWVVLQSSGATRSS